MVGEFAKSPDRRDKNDGSETKDIKLEIGQSGYMRKTTVSLGPTGENIEAHRWTKITRVSDHNLHAEDMPSDFEPPQGEIL